MKRTHLGIGLLSLGILTSIAGWVTTALNFCLWSCSSARETAYALGLVGFFGGFLLVLVGAVLYERGKSGGTRPQTYSHSPLGATKKTRLIAAVVVLVALIVTPPILFAVYTGNASSQSGLLWTRTWGGSKDEIGYGVAVDSSGNSYVTGYTQSFGPGSPTYPAVSLIKYDPAGSLLWQRVWSANGNSGSWDHGNGVAVDGSGNIYVTGDTSNWSTGTSDVLILKFNSSGSLLWQKSYANSGDPYSSAAVDSSGNIYLAGQTVIVYPGDCSNMGCKHEDLLLLKFDSNGALLWQKTVGGNLSDGVYNTVAVDSSGSVYVAGSTWHTTPYRDSDVFLLKFDPSGSLVWQKTVSGSDLDFAHDLAVDSSDSIYVAGWTWSFGAGGPDVLLLKFNSSGGLVWQRTWGGDNYDLGNGVAVDSTGSVYVTGYTWSFSVGAPVLLLKFNSSGSLVWQETWGGNMYEDGRGIAVDSAGNALVTGLVYEVSPHNLGSSGNNTLGTPNFSLGEANFTFRNPTLALNTPTGAVLTPSGSQSFGGSVDEFLIKFTSAGPAGGRGDVFGLPSLEFYAFTGGAVILVGALTTMLLRRRTRRLATSKGFWATGKGGTWIADIHLDLTSTLK